MFTLADWPLLAITAGLILALLVFLRWYEPRMVFYPHIPGRSLEANPGSHGLEFKELNLNTGDGARIHGWLLRSGAPYIILLCHGNAGNISHRIEKAGFLISAGYDVALFDYRGYGQSEGVPNEVGLYTDAEAIYQHLITGEGYKPQQIVLYGESLGTGVAVHLAANNAVAGLILEAAYTSIPDVAQRIFWFLPVRYLVRNRFESIKKIGRVQAPILLFHSREDRIFSIQHALKLKAAATAPSILVELKGSHDSAYAESAEIYLQAMKDFRAQLPACNKTRAFTDIPITNTVKRP